MAQKFTVPIVVRNLSASSSDALAVSVDGDTYDRIKFEAGGRIVWGTGASAGDVNLYRPSADLLKTDDAFQAAGIVTLTSDGPPTEALPDGALAVDVTNETLYVRANNAWVVASGGGGASVTTSDSPPSSPDSGDLWYETATGSMFVYYDDGDSQQWVEVGTAGVIAMTTSSDAPSTPSNGDLWFDTDTARTYVYYDDGSSQQWVEVGAASAAASGENGYIQFATGGTFNSASALVWDNANSELEVTGTVIADNVTISGTTATADLTVAGENVTPYTGRRNIIYNGAMQVAQRSTSVTGITTNNYHTVDRWRQGIGSMGTWTLSQEADGPTGSGFARSAKFLCTTADAAPAAGDFLFFSQRLEGQDLQQVKKGTSSAEQLTVSFWVKSNVTGTYVVELRDEDNSRHVGATYSVVASGTWEKKTVTFPADTTGAFDNDAVLSLEFAFWLGAGTNFTSGTLPTTWGSLSNANRAVGVTNLAAATNNYWQVTGVQLEVGDKATPFEHRSFGEELTRCQRYYQKFSDFAFGAYASALNESVMGTLPFLREMRANPTVTITSNGTTSRLSSVAILSASTTCAGVQLVATGAGFVGMWASTAANAAIEL